MPHKLTAVKRILITGGNGFIGSHVTEAYVRNGYSVSLIIRPGSDIGRIAHIKKRIKIFPISIVEKKRIQNIVSEFQPNFVFHFAAILNRGRPLGLFKTLYAVNVQGTLNLIEALSGCTHLKRFIHIGTMEEYGSQHPPFRETQREMAISPYSLTKIMSTHIVQYACQLEKFPAVILRPSVVYGPRQNNEMFIPSLIHAGIQKKTFKMTLGEQKRDFIYISDFLKALQLAVETQNIEGQIFNIGSGRVVSIKSTATLIAGLVKNHSFIRFGALPYRENENMCMVLDISKARQLLGWQPQYTLNKGLIKTIKWYKQNL